MCGLVGLICNSKYGFNAPHRDIFKQMLFADTLRGADATGVFMVNKHGNVRGLKQAVPAPSFVQSTKFDESMKDFLFDVFAIGHNRKATIGDKGASDNAHPFMTENLILVHNGTLQNHEDLNIKAANIDSEAIVHSFESIGIQETLKKINGAYALIWYNIAEKKLHFIRNSQRPLFMLKSKSLTGLSSEPGLGYWIMARNNNAPEEVVDVKPGTLYTVSADNPETIEETVLDLTRPFVSGTGMSYGAGSQAYRSNVSYAPRERVYTKQELDDLETLFFTAEDYSSMGLINIIKSGDMVMFRALTVERADEANVKQWKFTGKLVNVDPAICDIHIEGRSYIDMQVGNTYYGGVVSAVSKHPTHNVPGLEVRAPKFAFCKYTKNGVAVSYKMFEAPYTEKYCQQCLKEVGYNEIESLNGLIDPADNILRFEHPGCGEQEGTC